MIVLALDCGGSTCRARFVDTAGAILHEGKSGPANWSSTPRQSLLSHLREAVEGGPKPDFALACMAGLLTNRQKAEASDALAEISGAPRAMAVPDYVASLASCDDPNAVCVVSGTGSLVCSFDESHQVVKSGGGGPLLGDWGSGYWAGRTALGRFLFPREHAAPSPEVRSALSEVFGSDEINECLAAIYQAEGPPAPKVAAFGSVIARKATEGDEYCQSILADAMQPLADLTIEHMRQQGFPQRKFKVYRTGGFWEASHFIPKFFEMLLHLPTHVPPLSPLEGAVRIAQQYGEK